MVTGCLESAHLVLAQVVLPCLVFLYIYVRTKRIDSSGGGGDNNHSLLLLLPVFAVLLILFGGHASSVIAARCDVHTLGRGLSAARGALRSDASHFDADVDLGTREPS